MNSNIPLTGIPIISAKLRKGDTTNNITSDQTIIGTVTDGSRVTTLLGEHFSFAKIFGKDSGKLQLDSVDQIACLKK